MSLTALTIVRRLTTRAKLRHMQALIALCDLGSMGRAAMQLGITQPAMSQLVAELERLIETKLFLRHSKGVDPTPTALDLLPIAQRMIAAAEEGAERIATHHRRDGGLVRVATTAAATGAILDPILAGFVDVQPNIQVQATTVIGPTLDASFKGGEFDIVCCRRRETIPEGWSFQACIGDALVAICGPTHPLASKVRVSKTDLGRSTWLQNHVSTVARHAFDNLVEREVWTGLSEIQIQTRVPLLIWTMLKTGKYLTLVPRSVAAPWLSEGLLCELPAELNLPLEPLGVHWRPDHAGSAVRQFIQALPRLDPLAA